MDTMPIVPVPVPVPVPMAMSAIAPVPVGAVYEEAQLPVAASAVVAVQGGAVYQEVMSAYAPPMSAETALATAEAEGLLMPRSNGKTGFRGVTHVTGKKARPYQAWVCREGKLERLGRFATPEEAALCRARTPEGKKAASRCAGNPNHMSARGGKSSPAPMTLEEAEAQAEAAENQAEAEGLRLVRSDNQTGYLGVYVNTSNKVKPFEARVRRGGQRVFIGHFATAEEAALEVARVVADEPEGKKKRAPPRKKQKTEVEALTLAADEEPEATPVVQA